jgi:hypothetical protein
MENKIGKKIIKKGFQSVIGPFAVLSALYSGYKASCEASEGSKLMSFARAALIIAATRKRKYDSITAKINEMIVDGRPVLVIMPSIEETLEFSVELKSERIAHQILNDVQIEDEDYIVRRAGYPRAVTIATNAAGRGTDIV